MHWNVECDALLVSLGHRVIIARVSLSLGTDRRLASGAQLALFSETRGLYLYMCRNKQAARGSQNTEGDPELLSLKPASGARADPTTYLLGAQ